MKHAAVLLTLWVWSAGNCPDRAFACDEGMVRDAAFDGPRDTYRLCVISRTGAVAGREIAGRLGSWLKTTGAALNLEVVRLAADDPQVRWSDYGLPAAPPELPVVVLVGKRPANPQDAHANQNFFVDHWQPEPTAADLQVLLTSPARAALRRELGRNLAVLVWVPENGGGSGDGVAGSGGSVDGGRHDKYTRDGQRRIHEVVDQCHRSGFGQQAWGVSLVAVDRHDPRERLLLSFLGIQPEGPDWVGVVFGRGKFMTPPLEGEGITAAGIKACLATLAADCTCTQSPARLGVDLLMRWQAADAEKVVRLAPGPPSSGPDRLASAAALAGLPQAGPGRLSPLVRITVWLFSGLIVVSGIGSAAIFWYHTRRDPRQHAD